MKKELFDLLKQIGFVFVYCLGDVIVRWLTGKNEIPVYYWICVGLSQVHQITTDLEELKEKHN